MIREYITYSPPKGNLWGHKLRFQTAKRSWEAIRVFLESCTVHEPMRLHALTVHAVRPWDAEAVARSYSAEVRAEFGPPHNLQQGGLTRPNGEQQRWFDEEWNAEALSFQQVLTFLSNHEPWPNTLGDAVSLRTSVRFQWRDPSTGQLMPHQDRDFGTPDGSLQSGLEITFGRRTHIMPDFNFPLPEGSPRLPALGQSVRDSFPATLHEKHFRAVTPLASGSGYRQRKMVISPFTSA
ncbi:MAG: hypothetical protein ACO1Q7_16765 [Gemmatimonas sp.]